MENIHIYASNKKIFSFNHDKNKLRNKIVSTIDDFFIVLDI
jgi:hypothetical protein